MKLSLPLFAIVFATAAHAQVKGVVKNYDNTPLQDATIINIRTASHTHSNENGYFFLKEARQGDTVRITHVSYAAQSAVVGRDSLQIVLEPAELQLDEVTINQSLRHLNIISDIDLKINPVNSSQELLRKVPGLFIGQHAGGGKAEQIFLRGFDIDHGTDINISVDGMPVNMVSHAHGQGYADLHFLIPETVEQIDFDKGPYFANRGDLATAGYVAFKTKDRIDNSSVTCEGGKFNTFRLLTQLSLVNTAKQSAWFAADYLNTDGYFDSPQDFHRLNLAGKYSFFHDNDKLTLGFTHFQSKWNASGQIPERAVDNGTISRFGAIDNTEGGETARTNANLLYTKSLTDHTSIKATAFYSNYQFELYSNFTFFLNDPINGDQIRQKEQRNLSGFEVEYSMDLYGEKSSLKLQGATGLRNDDVDNIELSHTVNRRTTLKTIQLGDVDQLNAYGYMNAEWKSGKWLINPALRLDYLQFDYLDKLAASYQTQSRARAIASPKLNVLYNPNKNLQLFLKLGKGFHSNDARVVVAQMGKEILPAAYGVDAGIIVKPAPKLILNAALWYLYLQQEFVYVGDEGVVEPSGRTERKGIDLGLRYQLAKYLFFNGDFTYTHARAMGEAKGSDYIPLAPKLTFAGGIAIRRDIGFNGSMRTRLLGDRAANEDRSLIAKGYCITDVNVNYQWKNFSLGLVTENIFNSDWKETQFATETRLKNEPAPVTEIHFTPGTPFNIRAVGTFKF